MTYNIKHHAEAHADGLCLPPLRENNIAQGRGARRCGEEIFRDGSDIDDDNMHRVRVIHCAVREFDMFASLITDPGTGVVTETRV
jgi:hypothetical protein